MKKKIVVAIITALALSFCFCLLVKAGEETESYLDDDIMSACEIYGQRYGICPELLMALVETESSGRESAVNGTCYGICQINGAVWGYDYTTTEQQIDKACQILLEYADSHCGDINCALMKYNGEPNAEKLCDMGMQTEYSKVVLDRTKELEIKHGK